jgi:hypothetical protein
MSKTLYEEALADVRQLKEVAEANARRSLMDTVTPKIKELIESQLFGEKEEEILEDDEENLEESGFGSTALGVDPPGSESGPASVESDTEEEDVSESVSGESKIPSNAVFIKLSIT